MTAILGISAYYHDSAAALVVDGSIVAAAQEERFSRVKHDEAFPTQAIEACLEQARLVPEDLDFVGFYDKPLLKFDRLLETYLAFAPRGFRSFARAMPVWLKEKLHLAQRMRHALGGAYRKRFVFTEHHESHAASAFFPSPFEEAAILTLDGVGEWATASLGVGRGHRIELTDELRFPHSLGLLYSAFTSYCGFRINDGEYKLMGLAPYGQPVWVETILRELLDLKDDGSFRLDLSYFDYCHGLTMTSKRFHRLFGGAPRRPEEPIEERHMDLAASIQEVTEEIVLRMARDLHRRTGMTHLCLAGGVALNCVANGRLLREGPFEDLWIQPAAGDAGGALGVALFIWHQLMDQPRHPRGTDAQRGSLLGPAYDDLHVGAFLHRRGAIHEHLPDDARLCERIAAELDAGKVVGWFQGPLEFGPRALGSRSILADPRRPEMQATINLKVKFREGFRPFAPIVRAERAGEFFDLSPRHESPYMLLVTQVRKEKCLAVAGDVRGFELLCQERSVIPAVTHVDSSARVQTVDAARHALLYRLLEAFERRTGCPVLVNTSFNLGWDPIVATPEDAYRTFMASDLDVLCLGHYVLTKSDQRASSASVRPDDAPGLLESACSPCCRAGLSAEDARLVCQACGHAFTCTEGIPQLFWPHDAYGDPGDVTETVKAFYEETPFPNYDDHDTLRSLIDKSRRGIYASCLDRSIPYDTQVLEVGCGTGQLTNFLGISCRRVVGTDLCLNSLRLAETFRRKHGLDRVRFLQMNLFRPALRLGEFDVVLCNGVLHHTSDPAAGFQALVPLLRPGGHIVVGLYNRYGRLLTDLRRGLFRLTGGRARWIDPILRRDGMGKDKRRAWFADQYRHPHESKHTVGEVLEWFDAAGLEFVRGVPSTVPGPPLHPGEDLFHPQPRGTRQEQLLSQLAQVATGAREGGFYLMIGRKPSARSASDPAVPGTRRPSLALSGESTL